MSSKTVYQTDHMGLYVGPANAQESPLEPGVFLIPGGCVEVAPPDAPEGKIQSWNGRRWQLLDYFNGLIVYNTNTGEPLTLTGAGPIPNGYTLSRPQPGQVWKNGRWVDDLDTVLARLYPQKLDMINSTCARMIDSGFTSDALGGSFRYDSALEDQMNLTGLILSEFDAPYPCYGDDAQKTYREHTAEQLHTVGLHLLKHKQSALQKADHLKRELLKTLTLRDLAAMRAIEWDAPE
ncbi:hypothetical protein AB1462_16350 [Pseudomonas sp. SB113]|uniref:DUF4376 domain-containing protein n=1 Tax=Pseudomonas sp. SB113 TaxID=3154123 RepID=UPI00345D2719